MALSKTLVSTARGSPRGTQMPSPRAAIKLRMSHPRDCNKIANVPPPGLTTRANAPRLPGGWALLELTDALQELREHSGF